MEPYDFKNMLKNTTICEPFHIQTIKLFTRTLYSKRLNVLNLNI